MELDREAIKRRLDILYPTPETEPKKKSSFSLSHLALDFIGSMGTAISLRVAGKHLANKIITGLALAPGSAGASMLLTGLSLIAEIGGYVLWDAIMNKKDPVSVAIDWGGFLSGMEIGGKITEKTLLKKLTASPIIKATIKNLAENLSGWAMTKSLNKILGHEDNDLSPIVMAGFAFVPAGLHTTGKIMSKIKHTPQIEKLIDKTYLKLTGMPKQLVHEWKDFLHDFFGKRQFLEYDIMLIDKNMKNLIFENKEIIDNMLTKWIPLTLKNETELLAMPDIIANLSNDVKAMQLTQIGLYKLYQKIGLFERNPELMNSSFVKRIQNFLNKLTPKEHEIIDNASEILMPLTKYLSVIEDMEKILSPLRTRLIEDEIKKYQRKIRKVNEDFNYFVQKMQEKFGEIQEPKIQEKYQTEIKRQQTKTEAKIKKYEEKIKFLQEQAKIESKALNYFYLTHLAFENPTRLEKLAQKKSIEVGEIEDLKKLTLEFVKPIKLKQYMKRRIFYTPLDRVFFTYQRTGKVIGLRQGYSYFNVLLHRFMVGDFFHFVPKILALAEKHWIVKDALENAVYPIASRIKIKLGSESINIYNPKSNRIETFYLNHPEIKEMLNNFNSFLFGKDTGAMFFTGSESTLIRLNGLLKRLQVSLGFVHHKALTTATLGILGSDAKDIIFYAYLNMIKGLGIEILNKEPQRFAFYEQLMQKLDYVKNLAKKQGIKLPEIISKREFVNLTRLEEWEEKLVKGVIGEGWLAEAFLKIQKFISPFEKSLWNYFFNYIKVESAKRILESGLSKEAKEKALKEIGSVVGGNIDWEILKLTKTGQRTINWIRFLLFAPDWSLSMIRHVTKTIEFPELFGSFFSRILPLGYILAHHIAKAIDAPDPVDVFIATKNPIDLFSVYVYDAIRGKWKRFNLIGFEIEGMEFLGILPAIHALNNFIKYHDLWKAVDTLVTDWIDVVRRKPSSILRFFEEFIYQARDPHKSGILEPLIESTTESLLPISLKEFFRIAMYNILSLHLTDLASSRFLFNFLKSSNVYTTWDKKLIDGLGVWLLETTGLLRIYSIGETNKFLAYFMLAPKKELYNPQFRKLFETILQVSYKRNKEGLISAWRPILKDLGLTEYNEKNIEKMKEFAKGKIAEYYIWAGVEALRRIDKEEKRALRRIKAYE